MKIHLWLTGFDGVQVKEAHLVPPSGAETLAKETHLLSYSATRMPMPFNTASTIRLV